jgi:hypothetical protein
MKVLTAGWVALGVTLAVLVSAHAAYPVVPGAPAHAAYPVTPGAHYHTFRLAHGQLRHTRYHIFTRNPHRCNVSLCIGY